MLRLQLRQTPVVTALLLLASGASAAEQWRAQSLNPSSLPPEIVEEARPSASNGLPDGLTAIHDGKGDIEAAWYAEPTTRYRHGILGDAIEAGALKVETATGEIRTLTLPRTEVFEDRAPRLADLDGDGTIEVVAIRS